MLFEERRSLSLLHLNRLLCLLINWVCSKQDTLNPEIQTPAIHSQPFIPAKKCFSGFDSIMFLYLRMKTTEAWKQEWMWRIMSCKPLAPPEMCSVLKLLDTTMWKAPGHNNVRNLHCCSWWWAEMQRTSVLLSCSPWSPALTFLQISRPECPITEKLKWWMLPPALIICEIFFW